jgi:hypothetical protein
MSTGLDGATALYNRARSLLAAGQLAEAHDLADLAGRSAVSSQGLGIAASSAALAAQASLSQGRLVPALGELAACAELLGSLGDPLGLDAAHRTAEVALLLDDPDAALAWLEQGKAFLPDLFDRDPTLAAQTAAWRATTTARAFVLLGDLPGAVRETRETSALAELLVGGAAVPPELLWLHRKLGDHDGAASHERALRASVRTARYTALFSPAARLGRAVEAARERERLFGGAHPMTAAARLNVATLSDASLDERSAEQVFHARIEAALVEPMPPSLRALYLLDLAAFSHVAGAPRFAERVGARFVEAGLAHRKRRAEPLGSLLRPFPPVASLSLSLAARQYDAVLAGTEALVASVAGEVIPAAARAPLARLRLSALEATGQHASCVQTIRALLFWTDLTEGPGSRESARVRSLLDAAVVREREAASPGRLTETPAATAATEPGGVRELALSERRRSPPGRWEVLVRGRQAELDYLPHESDRRPDVRQHWTLSLVELLTAPPSALAADWDARVAIYRALIRDAGLERHEFVSHASINGVESTLRASVVGDQLEWSVERADGQGSEGAVPLSSLPKFRPAPPLSWHLNLWFALARLGDVLQRIPAEAPRCAPDLARLSPDFSARFSQAGTMQRVELRATPSRAFLEFGPDNPTARGHEGGGVDFKLEALMDDQRPLPATESPQLVADLVARLRAWVASRQDPAWQQWRGQGAAPAATPVDTNPVATPSAGAVAASPLPPVREGQASRLRESLARALPPLLGADGQPRVALAAERIRWEGYHGQLHHRSLDALRLEVRFRKDEAELSAELLDVETIRFALTRRGQTTERLLRTEADGEARLKPAHPILGREWRDADLLFLPTETGFVLQRTGADKVEKVEKVEKTIALASVQWHMTWSGPGARPAVLLGFGKQWSVGQPLFAEQQRLERFEPPSRQDGALMVPGTLSFLRGLPPVAVEHAGRSLGPHRWRVETVPDRPLVACTLGTSPISRRVAVSVHTAHASAAAALAWWSAQHWAHSSGRVVEGSRRQQSIGGLPAVVRVDRWLQGAPSVEPGEVPPYEPSWMSEVAAAIEIAPGCVAIVEAREPLGPQGMILERARPGAPTFVDTAELLLVVEGFEFSLSSKVVG